MSASLLAGSRISMRGHTAARLTAAAAAISRPQLSSRIGTTQIDKHLPAQSPSPSYLRCFSSVPISINSSAPPCTGGIAASAPASSSAATAASAAAVAAASSPATRIPAAATAAPLQQQPPSFTFPTAQQLQQLYHRLTQPYASAAAVAAATTAGGRQRGSAALRPVAGECRILSLDVGDRFVGVALSDGGSGGGAACAGTGNRRAAPLLTLHRKHLVAATVSAPLSPHSHHSRKPDRRHTDLRGPGSSPGRMLRLRPISDVAAELRDLLRLHRCVGVVVGMPLTMAFGLDEQCTKTIEFVRQLQRALASPLTDSAATANATASAPRGKSPAPAVLPPFQAPDWFFWDERLTSADARHQLEHGAGVRAHSRAMAQSTDPLAAAIVLQEFLDRMHLTNKEATRTP